MKTACALLLVCAALPLAAGREEWPQLKFDSRRSGNAPDRSVTTPLGLVAAAPLTDAVFTAPAVAGGRVFVVDGAGAAFCLDAETLDVIWKVATDGGADNCNNVSSPAVAGDFVHFGTMAGNYYVLDTKDGAVVSKIPCGEPIFSAPVAGDGRIFFATLGSRVFALEPDGKICWTWDFVREHLKFEGDRWSGEAWAGRGGRVTWKEQFLCSRDMAVHGRMLVVPAGGSIVWLEDAGDRPVLVHVHAPNESPATFGLSLDAEGTVFRQWYRRDNGGSVEILRVAGGEVKTGVVPGTETSYHGPESMSFSSVSVRGSGVFRCRPESGFGFCRHQEGAPAAVLGTGPSVTPPILLKDHGIFGTLDGRLCVVPLAGEKTAWSFKTAFGKAITAPAAVCGGRVFFGCDDGYLYCLGPEGRAPLPDQDLQLWRIRSPLSGKLAGPAHDWRTSFGNMANTNAKSQGIAPPFKLRWIRPFHGTVKHFSVCGGGRLYTHTAEGQVFAVEQESGRLLWRTSFPGVHVSYTSPLYFEERLYLPQAGLEASALRCLDAATGRLLWEAPFTGSPSWNRQQPPVVAGDLVIYMFSTGRYTAAEWLFEHQSTFGFPADHKPLVRAWDRRTGKEVWTADFSEHGSGGDDAGLCLLDGTLYYSCYFGDKEPPGITAALEPKTGRSLWLNKEHAVHSGCTISGKDGRLYLGGYNPVRGGENRVFCLDAQDGSLVWQSDPVEGAIHVVTAGEDVLFVHAQYKTSYVLARETGKIIATMNKGYRCTRFTHSEPCLLAANMDILDLAGLKLLSTGPALDVTLCVGSIPSNGRLFFTANGGGLQASMMYGREAEEGKPPWSTGGRE